MTELLSGIRVIKFFGWEQALGARVEACRARELGRLWVIKYLDAACVYLWAALPVVISIVIFITYVLMGHQLTATKVRPLGRGGGEWLSEGVGGKQQHRDGRGVGGELQPSVLAGKATFFPNLGELL